MKLKKINEHYYLWDSEGKAIASSVENSMTGVKLNIYQIETLLGKVNVEMQRQFIGIEQEQKYYDIAEKRIGAFEKNSDNLLTWTFATKEQTEWEVEIEMEVVPNYDNNGSGDVFHKNKKLDPLITNGYIDILKIIK